MKKLLFVLGIILLGSCQKNEMDLTGDLVVKFQNTDYLSSFYLPNIYTVENTNYPLFEDITVDENGILKVSGLNYGNYFIEYTTKRGGMNVSYLQIFQIRAGKATKMTIEL